jgi:hypothetical protein
VAGGDLGDELAVRRQLAVGVGIGPAVGKVLAAAGITERPPEPVEQQLDVVDIWTSA